MKEENRIDDEAVRNMPLLEHFEKIVEFSEKKGFTDIFWQKAKPHLEFAAESLRITTEQAALFAHFLNSCDDQSICLDDIAKSVKCKRIKLLRYMDEFDKLEKKKYIRCRRVKNQMPTYRVPQAVINSIRKGEAYKPTDNKDISIEKFFDVVSDLFAQRINDELSFDVLAGELRDLITDNEPLEFCQKLKWYVDLYNCNNDLVLFFRMCDILVNDNDDAVNSYQLDDIFDTRSEFREIERYLKEGNHELMALGLIEFSNSDGYNDTEYFRLTDKAKSEFLDELNLKQKTLKRGRDFVFAKDIAAKELFFNKKVKKQIDELSELLEEDKFASVQNRLKGKGMRGGFACLFYGAPGTGKTETVYQIAKKTGRDILCVDMASTKSCWFGESEKKVKQIFDRYRSTIKSGGKMPILLFNEADAVIGKRTEVGDKNASIDKTLNAIQNIILQEIETLEGILIATTNFENNLDNAFERRFLYKIKFDKPELDARISIWQTIIPELSGSDAAVLAKRFDFSGGQIENVGRKCNVEFVIHGETPRLDKLAEYCDEERLEKRSAKIGFAG
ncbi:MAG: hypothetical protein Ta2B_06980 [Termitinemataceae bacterium]|nr:MAG: hypothetical protein Ta2B_06980 [Termitinemataceae bacterium]